MIENELRWDKAKGSNVWIDGKKYIDFTSSIFSQNFGHSNPYVIKEVDKQLDKCLHAYGYSTEIKEKYLIKLKEMTGYKNILLFSTGSESTEAAIKIVNYNKYKAVGMSNAMHGRTLGAEILTGKRPKYDISFCYNINNTQYINYGELDNDKAFFIEGYRGYDCRLLNKDEIDNINNLQQKGNLIVFDEIQSGFYRTNKIFIYKNYGIEPDILLIGKSMGGGLPLSAVCWNKDFNLNNIELTSTHSGQPLQMAAGYGILKYLDGKINFDEYEENIYLMDSFWNELKIEHNNLGMVGAFKCNDEYLLYKACLSEGLLTVKTWKGWIKIAPPVNIDTKQLQKGLNILRKYVD
jgi:acetylornithine/succinyldiaminopimelate/putrescine aminotransferase